MNVRPSMPRYLACFGVIGLSLTAGLLSGATTRLDNLLRDNPFAPPEERGAADRTVPADGTGDRIKDSFSFRGLARMDGTFAFSLYNREDSSAAWFRLREAGDWGLEVLAFDPETVTVTVSQEEETARLVIEEARPLRELSVGQRLTGSIDPKAVAPAWSKEPPPAPPEVPASRLKPPPETPVLPEAVRRRAETLLQAREDRAERLRESGSTPPAWQGGGRVRSSSSGNPGGGGSPAPGGGGEQPAAGGPTGPNGVGAPPASAPGAPPSTPPPAPPAGDGS
ncbi:MAG: hypothetical protein ACFE0O_15935 [Opitutales bacterium]